MKDLKLRVLVCGIGVMGERHVRLVTQIKRCQLVGLVDVNQEKLNALGKLHGVEVFTDLHRAIETLRPDAVVIATPTSCHWQNMQTVSHFDLPILLEKPIAQTTLEAEKIHRLAPNRKSIVMIGHVERFNPAVVKTREFLRQGEAGSIQNMSFRRIGGFPAMVSPGRDILSDVAVHDLDLARHLTGESATHISSIGLGDPVIWSATTLLMTSNTLIDLHVSWNSPTRVRTIFIEGTQCCLEVDLVNQSIRRYQAAGTLAEIQKSGNTKRDLAATSQLIPVTWKEPLREELERFFDAIINQTESPVSTGDGLEAVKLAEQAFRSLKLPNGSSYKKAA